MRPLALPPLLGLIVLACDAQGPLGKATGDTDPSASDSRADDNGDGDSGTRDDTDPAPTGEDSGHAGAHGDSDDTGTDGDSGAGGATTDPDTGTYIGACAPPDAWTGPVDPALYARQPFPSSYVAGLGDAAARCCGGTNSPHLIVDATVVLAESDLTYVADGQATLAVSPGPYAVPAVGDRVVFEYRGVRGDVELPSTARMQADNSDWHISSGDNPVPVRELGATALADLDGLARLTHAWGEITGPSNVDCGQDHSCFLLQHRGTQDKVRVPHDNGYGLDPDYQGGLCAELVAPGGTYAGSDGTAVFLDAHHATWMRVWPKP